MDCIPVVLSLKFVHVSNLVIDDSKSKIIIIINNNNIIIINFDLMMNECLGRPQ